MSSESDAVVPNYRPKGTPGKIEMVPVDGNLGLGVGKAYLGASRGTRWVGNYPASAGAKRPIPEFIREREVRRVNKTFALTKISSSLAFGASLGMAILMLSPKLAVAAGVGAIVLTAVTFAYLVWRERDVPDTREPRSS